MDDRTDRRDKLASTSLPDDAESAAAAILALTSSFRSQYRAFDPHEGLEGVFAMTLGWTIRMSRMAEAIVMLHRHGLDQEAAPLLRSLLEHAVTVRWLVDERDEALATIEYDLRRTQRLLKDSADEAGWALDPQGRELPPSDLDLDRPSEWPTFDNFKKLVEQCGDPSWYAIYRFESARAHPTYVSANAYHNGSVGTSPDFGMKWEPIERGTHLKVVAAWLLMGLGQLSEVAAPSDEFATALDEMQHVLEN